MVRLELALTTHWVQEEEGGVFLCFYWSFPFIPVVGNVGASGSL